MKILLFIIVVCLPIAACRSLFGFPETDQISTEYDTSPGKKLVVPHSEVWMLESCGSKELPYFRLDQTEVIPKTIKPGLSMRYRISYTACIPQQTSYILGRLETKILFKSKTENVRSDDGFRVETGKWVVDTHITVPKDAKPGIYILEAALSIKGGRLQDYVSFNVEP